MIDPESFRTMLDCCGFYYCGIQRGSFGLAFYDELDGFQVGVCGNTVLVDVSTTPAFVISLLRERAEEFSWNFKTRG